MKGWMYILECSDDSYYTGSTNDLKCRLEQHKNGEGANHTKKRLPVKLVYFEEYNRIDEAFYREKQVQGWSRKKKEALINNMQNKLPECSIAYRDLNTVVSRALTTERDPTTEEEIIFKTKSVTEALEVTTPKPVEGNNSNKKQKNIWRVRTENRWFREPQPPARKIKIR